MDARDQSIRKMTFAWRAGLRRRRKSRPPAGPGRRPWPKASPNAFTFQ